MKFKEIKFKEGYIVFLLAFMLLGASITVQVRSTVTMQRQAAEILDTDKLKIQLDEKIKTGEGYKAQIDEMETDISAFLAAPDNDINISTKNELDYLKLISGLTDVTGEGVLITLNDAEMPESETAMDYIIHDKDIYSVVNQLKMAGAIAIAINNERIIATSEQICAGPTVKINNNRYAVPYEIKAIGDSEVLYEALKDSYLINDMLTFKKRVTFTKENNIIIPKFANDINGLISRLEVINDENKKNQQ
ncbi:uncharacterized protein YlxW (UPF0749 family) [Ruminiclostridium sufflavum DSM 19573]|uniref:Uncharacterized protein YlxW (UPF0749 family) n=1 Tax=Ruminiclostridium sufflavum DSM 19573 TaxID=1121337 RepID=A0A318XZX6_9FIRM|nr:DUF881 domain-containing protein [Ruminiclostridium sufflavum]PYG88550.1 uncharacterized protein YlxW (UPF0749 family) [Ruminiclostridium sufflavum DSM 19573]